MNEIQCWWRNHDTNNCRQVNLIKKANQSLQKCTFQYSALSNKKHQTKTITNKTPPECTKFLTVSEKKNRKNATYSTKLKMHTLFAQELTSEYLLPNLQWQQKITKYGTYSVLPKFCIGVNYIIILWTFHKMFLYCLLKKTQSRISYQATINIKSKTNNNLLHSL